MLIPIFVCNRTDFVVRPSTDQEKMAFQNQVSKFSFYLGVS